MRALWWKEENWPTLKKSREGWRNPAVNGFFNEDPVPQKVVTNCLQRIGSKPITFDNAFTSIKWELLSQRKVKYVEDIIVTRKKEVIQMISDT